MADYKLISADSHVSEPPDLWVERVDKKYRERAPRLVIDPPGRRAPTSSTRATRRIRSASGSAPARAPRNWPSSSPRPPMPMPGRAVGIRPSV